MDHFGIGTALISAANIVFNMARRTGRTTSMLESLRNGDVIVTSDHSTAQQLKILLRERKLQVEIRVVNPTFEPVEPKLAEKGTPAGRLVFDHVWVEQFYESRLRKTGKDIDRMQREFSGYGTAHIETRRKYELK